ncbi:MAG: CHAT domain-containing protein [Anaerolineales bacterium]|nr:CHAT domain-containing protein [Anaerolineales bacterium]
MPKFVHAVPFIIHPADDSIERQPALRHASARLANYYVDKRPIAEAELQAMGAALWQSLPADTGERFEAAIKAAGASILPVVIESRVPTVQNLPWETLYHPARGFLARNPSFAFSRRIEPPTAKLPEARTAPLKVLLFTSLPDDLNPETERLNVEKEQERVQEALLPFVAEGRAQLEIPDDGRLETLIDLLKRFEPHVLYLSGHGKFVQPLGGEHEPFGIFLFESAVGKSEPVTEERLAQVLVGSGVQVVVISACESGKAASDDLNHGLVRRLSAMGIPHVMGMRESVLDEAGIQFADALCKALAEGERADVAIQTARAAMTASADGVSRRETSSAMTTDRLHGQWSLPMLISVEPSHLSADWSSFTPKPRGAMKAGASMRFIGRRKELRQYKHRLLTGGLTRLFISGAGGHGKTTLARKLARDLEGREYKFFEWRADTPWRDFQSLLAEQLKGDIFKSYDVDAIRFQNQPEKLAVRLFESLATQYAGKVVLLFDNLEAIQDDQTFKLTDPLAEVWLRAACGDKMNFVVLATSRWVLPDWSGEHLPLGSMNKGDFLRLAQTLTERGSMNPLLLIDRERLNKAYETLGHNPRGLEWFAAATLTMNPREEQAFAEKLAQTRADLRQNMALEETLNRLTPDAFALLRRLHVYESPVPEEGIVKLIALPALIPNPSPAGEGSPLSQRERDRVRENEARALENLLAFSLLEITDNKDYETLEYQIEPSLFEYLRDNDLLDDDLPARNAAADYMLWLMKHERKTYSHLALTIESLRRAKRHAEADRLTLGTLIGRYTLDGRYAELLTRWLPEIRDSPDKKTQAEALGQTGKLHVHVGMFKEAMPYFEQSLDICRQIGDKAGEGATLNNISQIYDAQGDYATALTYLQQSLAIQQQIGDKAGLCATLFNMGHIHAQNDQIQEAVSAWVTTYILAKQMNLAQALKALADLAPQLGLPEGLEGWEMLVQRMKGEE